MIVHINPTIDLFFSFHNFSHSTSFPAKRNWNIFADPKIDKITKDRWHSKWFFVKGGMDEAILKVWVPLEDSNRPIMPKKMPTMVRAELETLRQVFDKPVHYKVFCEEGILIQAGLIRSKEYDPTLVPPVSWDDVLNAARRCAEPKDVPFSTMVGERQPLFRKTKVRKVPTSSDAPRKENSPATTATAATSTCNAGKRPASEGERPKLFSQRKKHISQRPNRVEHLTISEDPRSASPPPPAPADSVNLPSPTSVQEMPHLPSGSLPEDGPDLGPMLEINEN
ncbi:hypothetical protein LIER_40610 [Lithospermum erythrorhizon]|uniref:Uncharacterized protein n=1 Tax=Lithospermum erythrorhizon TaxID=34254 RepID=A0AAV3QYK1_LITER